jgi:tRNA-intron endonuclease
MDGDLRDGVVYVGGDARQRFYDSRGYGRTLDEGDPDYGHDGVALSRVEAAHLLYRGDVDGVCADGRTLGFRAFLASAAGSDDHPETGTEVGAGFLVRFLVYADLRDRGFYLSPTRPGWPGATESGDAGADANFAVYERGRGPGEGGEAVAYHLRVVGERERLRVADLDEGVLAVVDEESDVTYFETDRSAPEGTTDHAPPTRVRADLLADRVVCWDPPTDLYHRGFFGQPLSGHGTDAVQLSLVETAYLVAYGAVELDATEGERSADDATPVPTLAGLAVPAGARADYTATVARGRAVEGDRFDRRLRTYAALRDAGVVPKTGFKFGADFRTYADVENVDDLGHSELLVRALPADERLGPRNLALDVRLAHGVRKRMVFALVDTEGIEWRSAVRLTP